MSWLLAVALFGLHAGIQRDAGVVHVRSTDAAMLEVIREGSRRSTTFKSLVDALNQTSTIVYVERGVCGFGHYAACLPHTVTLAGSIRYLRILVDPSRAADVTGP